MVLGKLAICLNSVSLSRMLVLFDLVPCAHERCDPCEFLLALRSFIELVSVMVRFRSSAPRRYFDRDRPEVAEKQSVWNHGRNASGKPRSRTRLTLWHMILAFGTNICIELSSDPRSTCEFVKLGPNMLKIRRLVPNILKGRSKQT